MGTNLESGRHRKERNTWITITYEATNSSSVGTRIALMRCEGVWDSMFRLLREEGEHCWITSVVKVYGSRSGSPLAAFLASIPGFPSPDAGLP